MVNEWPMVDVSLEEIEQGRPTRRSVYKWPICTSCDLKMKESQDKLRRLETRETLVPPAGTLFLCCRCGVRTNSYIFAKWPSRIMMPDLGSYMHLRRDLIHLRWAGSSESEEEPLLEKMDKVWYDMSTEERNRVEAMPQFRIGEEDLRPWTIAEQSILSILEQEDKACSVALDKAAKDV